MRIAQIAPLDYVVPPPQYGGVERVVSCVSDALVELGHEVTLFALEGSVSRAQLVGIELPSIDERPEGTARLETYRHNDLLAAAYERRGDFDVIHSHLEYMTFPFARSTGHPTVVTQHGRLDSADLRAIYALGLPSALALTSVSEAQWRPMADIAQSSPTIIPNPVPLERYEAVTEKDDYFAFLGRISPEKAPHIAAQLSHDVGVQLVAAGVVHPGDEEYWEQIVQPAFKKAKVEWLGPVNDRQKQDLLGHARATIFPSDWPEAFGLVQVESMACGTPVVALDRGAANEIVTHGVSGYVCMDHEEMREALGIVQDLTSNDCRAAAERYSPLRIAEQYLAVYEDVAE